MKNDQFLKKLFQLVLPIMVQAFMLSLVSATDALMLGFVDQTSLSAVSLAGQVQFVLSLAVMGITAGCGIMAAQYWGKGDTRTIEAITPIAIRTMLLIGTGFFFAAIFIPGLLMNIFTNDAELISAGTPYLKAVALSYLLCAISQIYLTIMKNVEMVKEASVISSSAVVLNIILNAILIFGLLGAPALGIVGAAIATVISRAVELIWSVLVMQKKSMVQISWRIFNRTEDVLRKDFWKYTLPMLGASLVWGIAYTLYTVIIGHLGTDAVAAYSITHIAKSIISCLVKGLGTGAGIMVGNVLGAGKLDDAVVYGRRLTRISIIVGAISGGLLAAFSPLIVHFAPMSELASSYLQGMLLFTGLNLAFQSVNITVLDGIFCAGGDSKFDMYGNIGAMWCFGVPFGALAAFVFKWPVMIVFIIISLDEIVKMPAVYLRYIKYKWVKNITR